jgi:uncharacterized protein
VQFSGFDWDEGNWPKCAKHGVSKAEVEDVFRFAPLVLPDRNLDLDEAQYNADGSPIGGMCSSSLR